MRSAYFGSTTNGGGRHGKAGSSMGWVKTLPRPSATPARPISNRDTPRLRVPLSPIPPTNPRFLIATQRRVGQHPRPLTDALLIETSAIRNRCKPRRMSHFHFSNRDKTPLLSIFAFPFSLPALLIGSPAIRIRPKAPEINHLNFSNRHEMTKSPNAFDCGHSPSLAPPECLRDLYAPLWPRPRRQEVKDSPCRPFASLIGSSAIRIHRNSPRISHLNFSNRHEMAGNRLEKEM
jgi:hypothetical protein